MEHIFAERSGRRSEAEPDARLDSDQARCEEARRRVDADHV